MSRDNTFIIRMVDSPDNAWRGTITWVNDARCEGFRSALELISLIDSTQDSVQEDERDFA